VTTVRELIEVLSACDPDDLVVLQKDAEGNNYSPLESHWLAVYAPTTTWFGEAYPRELTDVDRERGYTDAGLLYDGDDGVNAVVLCPVN
jgi:hypothetical protein